MNKKEHRDKLSVKALARWRDPEWVAAHADAYRNRMCACKRHHDDVAKWAADGVSAQEIGRRIGTVGKRVRHYLRRHNLPYTYVHYVGSNNPAWAGGRIIDKHGYVLTYQPEHPHANSGGYVREHRLVMEKILGRYLEPHEVVHHENDDRQNNAPANLRLFGTNGAHLAETLAGKPHNCSADGRRRLSESAIRTRRREAAARISAHKTDGLSS